MANSGLKEKFMTAGGVLLGAAAFAIAFFGGGGEGALEMSGEMLSNKGKARNPEAMGEGQREAQAREGGGAGEELSERSKAGDEKSEDRITAAVERSFYSGLSTSFSESRAKSYENKDFTKYYAKHYLDILSTGKVDGNESSLADVVIAMNMMLAQGKNGEEEARNKANEAWRAFNSGKDLVGPAKFLHGALGVEAFAGDLFSSAEDTKAVSGSAIQQEILQSISLSDSGMLKIPCSTKESLVNAVKCIAMNAEFSTVTIDLANSIKVGDEVKSMSDVAPEVLQAIHTALEGKEVKAGTIEIVGDFAGETFSMDMDDFLNLESEDFQKGKGEGAGFLTELFGKLGTGFEKARDAKDSKSLDKKGFSLPILSMLNPKPQSLKGRDRGKDVTRAMAVSALKTAAIGFMAAKHKGGGVRDALRILKQERDELNQIIKGQENAAELFGENVLKVVQKIDAELSKESTQGHEKLLELLEEVAKMDEKVPTQVHVPVQSLKDQMLEELLKGNSINIEVREGAESVFVREAKQALREALGQNPDLGVEVTISAGDKVIKFDKHNIDAPEKGTEGPSREGDALVQGADSPSAVELVEKGLATLTIVEPEKPAIGAKRGEEAVHDEEAENQKTLSIGGSMGESTV